MAKRDRDALLEDFKRNRRNRRVEEWLGLLAAWGVEVRLAAKEGYVVRKGSHTYTLPHPHGGDRALKLPYAQALLRLLDDVKAELELEGEGHD